MSNGGHRFGVKHERPRKCYYMSRGREKGPRKTSFQHLLNWQLGGWVCILELFKTYSQWVVLAKCLIQRRKQLCPHLPFVNIKCFIPYQSSPHLMICTITLTVLHLYATFSTFFCIFFTCASAAINSLQSVLNVEDENIHY